MVFISYSSRDSAAACAVRSMLEANGVKCWMAPESIPMGGDYANAIPLAIENCSVFLLILSENAQASKWVPKELDLAITFDKRVIPFQIDDGLMTRPFNFRLTNIQRIEAYRDLADAYEKLLSRIRSETRERRSDYARSELPAHVSYYQLLGVDDVSGIDVARLRAQSDITASLAVPFAVNSEGEQVSLDLHQRGDGPHGLVIGPPGCGKSEFLLTLSISLGLHFTPDEIRVHAVDLKDGSFARQLSGLPHLGDSLTEDSDEAAGRFVRSIREELRRRSLLLERSSASNIYQYLKLQKKAGSGMAPMPHLVIMIDELRDLKLNHPDAVAEIKTWGSRMNAALLGVHVIFSTSFFAGVVDDSIWNMCSFRICSTMQKDEFKAADLTEASRCPGRLYLGSRARSRVQLVQLAYCRTEIDDRDAKGYEWFFGRKDEKSELIDLIRRSSLD